MKSDWILAESSRVRYATGSAMYFAQGIPNGLMNITVPAWLASQGVGARQIAAFLALIIPPWVFKLWSGPLMDRFQFLPMGRRRPWVLGAQFGMTLSFFALVLIDDPSEQIGLLMIIGFLINLFSSTQDVATDGMTIEVTPVDEQGRQNSFMVFGKAFGTSISAAVTGVLVVTFGLSITAITAIAVQTIILLGFMRTLERRGERHLPWTAGEAKSERMIGTSFASLLKGLKAVLWTRATLGVMAIMLFHGFVDGYGTALMPIAAINLFGFTTPQWAQLVAVMGLIGAVAVLGFGPLIDRVGAKRMLIFTIIFVALHALLLAETQFLWENTLYVRAMLSAWVMLDPVLTVCVLALSMAVCSGALSATQFAVIMSFGNFGKSIGSAIYGLISDQTSSDQAFLLLAAFAVAMSAIVFLYRHKRHQTTRLKNSSGYTVGMGPIGSGVYFSGAMRCPKCRSDMELITIDEIEIDRCSSCHGLWFDDGELGALRNKPAAAAIDIGDVKIGKQQNEIENYRCPRCAGRMNRLADPGQKHIWFEQCDSCRGSFFDAGELTDLATLSLSDFFKRFVTAERS
jgi:PAT family beta-lactamase induction signal transducer AmpG